MKEIGGLKIIEYNSFDAILNILNVFDRFFVPPLHDLVNDFNE